MRYVVAERQRKDWRNEHAPGLAVTGVVVPGAYPKSVFLVGGTFN
jgi:hypothetical protein